MSETEVTNESEPQVTTTSSVGLELWNPKKAVLWSLLFSPIFGAFLHSKNWQAMGKPEEAKKSMYWVYGTIILLFANILLSAPTILMPIALIAWFFLSAKKQMAEIPEKYQPKLWKKPLKFGALGLVSVLLISLLFSSETNFDETDLVGTWRMDPRATAEISFDKSDEIEGATKLFEASAEVMTMSFTESTISVNVLGQSQDISNYQVTERANDYFVITDDNGQMKISFINQNRLILETEKGSDMVMYKTEK